MSPRARLLVLTAAVLAAGIFAVLNQPVTPSQQTPATAVDTTATAAPAAVASTTTTTNPAATATPTTLQRLIAQFAANPLQAARLGSAHFDLLLQAARQGDIEAARLLHAALSRCQDRPSAQDYAQLRQSVPEHGASLRNRAALDELMRDCSGLGEQQLGRHWEVLRHGAQAGDNELRVAYFQQDPAADRSLAAQLQQRRREYRELAPRFLQAAMAEGYADAYLSMGDAYTRGHGVSPDPVRAAAYKIHWLEQLRQSGIAAAELEAFSNGVARELATLSDTESLQARAFAQAISRGETP